MLFVEKYPISITRPGYYDAHTETHDVVCEPTLTYTGRYFACVECRTHTTYRMVNLDGSSPVPVCSDECRSKYMEVVVEEDHGASQEKENEKATGRMPAL